jgi:hypothetical protein
VVAQATTPRQRAMCLPIYSVALRFGIDESEALEVTCADR